MAIRRRIYMVTNLLLAMGGRVFNTGETLWWDGNETDPVTFEVDNVSFQAELKQFLSNVRIAG